MGSHLGICLLREHAVLPSTNEGRILVGAEVRFSGGGESKEMAKAHMPGEQSRNRGLQFPAPRNRPNYKALRRLVPSLVSKVSQSLSKIKPNFLIPSQTIGLRSPTGRCRLWARHSARCRMCTVSLNPRGSLPTSTPQKEKQRLGQPKQLSDGVLDLNLCLHKTKAF